VESTAVRPCPAEIERRYSNVRSAMRGVWADALIACASEDTGFEGAVRYLSGFRIVHRYAYVLLTAEGGPISVFPGEARWVGNHADGWVENRVFAETPGEWMRDNLTGARVDRPSA
jgi:hypothetical protein